MPIDRKFYPKNWDEIALQVKQEANWRCQDCDRLCRMPGESLADFCNRVKTARISECRLVRQILDKPNQFILTVAHIDQNPQNNDASNLRALCSVCHLNHDRPYRLHNSYRKRERRGQLSLPLEL